MSDRKRTAILGGTFDPVHAGHVRIAAAASKRPDIDEVVVIPASVPAFKKGKVKADISDRIAMCELAFEDDPRVFVSGIEAERKGTTYTFDTVKEMQRNFPDAELVFLIGSDAASQLPEWHKADELAREISFMVFPRAGTDEDTHMVVKELAKHGFDVELLDIGMPEVSSTDIRRSIAAGREIGMLVPETVARYINDKELYGS